MLGGVLGQQPGALTYSFSGQSTPGTISASWASITDANSAANQQLYHYGPINFTLPGQQAQVLSLGFDTALDFGASATITLTYDPTLLGTGVDASTLGMYHYHDGAWAFIGGTVDPTAQTITFQTDSFSPFAVGVAVPEPTSLALILLGGIALLHRPLRA